MRKAYWVVAVAEALFLGWAHCHTDEIPVVFGFVAIAGALLGMLAPRRFLLSCGIVAVPVPVVELLVHYSLIRAPYPPTPLKDLPIIAGVTCIPALIGVAVGAGLRRMTGTAAVV